MPSSSHQEVDFFVEFFRLFWSTFGSVWGSIWVGPEVDLGRSGGRFWSVGGSILADFGVDLGVDLGWSGGRSGHGRPTDQAKAGHGQFINRDGVVGSPMAFSAPDTK